MTIKVTVANDESEGGRSLQAEIIRHHKDTALSRTTSEYCGEIAPGETRAFYVHLLADLKISECEP